MKLPRFDEYSLLPDKWFVLGLVKDGPHDLLGQQDYYFVRLRLPSYQFMWSPCHAEDRWHQLTITYHGRRGFAVHWLYLWDQPEFA